ncbi:MAG TPA: DUF3261 domain-containing protein [Candidatus Aphodousia faecavium]|nr:DUF3261 domain-containing protein [Candidatus Aphodousia faecavium]
MSTRFIRRACCAAIALGLSGCSLWQGFMSEESPATATFPTVVPAISALTQPFNAFQHIHAEIENDRIETKTADFDAMVSADRHSMKVALVALGTTVWQIDYDGMVITEERSEHVPQTMQAQYLLRDLAMVYWPKETLTTQLKDWTITETNASRAFFAPGDTAPTIEVTYENGAAPMSTTGKALLVNHLHDYRLIIESSPVK